MTKISIVLEGKDLNQIIQMGLKELDKNKDQVTINVLEKGKTIAGLSIKKYKIEIIVNEIDSKETVEVKNTDPNVEEKTDSLENEKKDLNDDCNTLERFGLLYKEDGVYLSVKPKNNITANFNEILEKVKAKKVKEVDYSKIEEAIKSGEKVCIKIAPEQDEILIDSTIEIEISKDKMSCYMTVYPADGGKEFTEEEVVALLKEKIKFGIDVDIVNTYVKQRKYKTRELIAKGIEAIDGKDGYIDYKFRDKTESSPYMLEDGSVDFRKLNLIKNVIKGDILAELYSSEEGTDGMNVLGEEIKYKPGTEKSFNYGINISLSENHNQLISEIDGQICMENGKLIVYELYTVSKDVDNSTGNIEFNGNIKINGNVLTGFTVMAKGNIEIDGVVEGATVKCGGDLFIKRGIQGYNVADIQANGSIMTKYIENAKIHSAGDVESEAIMHSETICGGSVLIGGKKGLLVGGMCKAEGEISARVIGSHMATHTLLEVGIDPTVRENQEKLKQMKKETLVDIDKFDKMIQHLNKMQQGEELSLDKQDMLDKSILAKAQLEKKKISLDVEMELIDEKIKDASKGTINVKETIYSGVKITIGNSTMLMQEKRDYCTIYRSEGEIKIGPFAE